MQQLWDLSNPRYSLSLLKLRGLRSMRDLRISAGARQTPCFLQDSNTSTATWPHQTSRPKLVSWKSKFVSSSFSAQERCPIIGREDKDGQTRNGSSPRPVQMPCWS